LNATGQVFYLTKIEEGSMSKQVPIQFIRGSQFSYLFELPEELPDDYFNDWTAEAIMRRKSSNLKFDQIGPVDVYHYTITENRILFYIEQTIDWPLGEAELFVRFVSPHGYKLIPNPVQFVIRDGGF
jgi:hypothetical protein